jgi:hypothetical protein
MTYWLEHRFKDHSSELEFGSFVSPVTNDQMTLSNTQRGIALAVLLCMPQDPNKKDPLGFRFGYRITKAFVERAIGKPISDGTYRDFFDLYELAGVFELERELGSGHILRPGKLLLCELYPGCDPVTHNPYWLPGNPSDSNSTPYGNDRSPLQERQESPPNSLDINNLNKPLITLNTDLGIEKVLLVEDPDPREPGGDPEPHPDLPQRIISWLDIRRDKAGLDTWRPGDIANANEYWERTGQDLPETGSWTSGASYPFPKQ